MTTLIPRLPEEMVREVKGYIDFNLESTNKDYLDESNLNTNTKFIAIMENYPPLMTMLEEFTGEEMAKIYNKYVVESLRRDITAILLYGEKMFYDDLIQNTTYNSFSKNRMCQVFSLLLLVHHNFHPYKVKRGYKIGTIAYNLYRCIAVLYKMKKKITNIMNQLCVTGSIFHELSKFDISVLLNVASIKIKCREFNSLTYNEGQKKSSKIESNDSIILIGEKIRISNRELKVARYLQRLNKIANNIVKFGNKTDIKNNKLNQLKLLKIAKADAKKAEKDAKVAAKLVEKETKKAAKAVAKLVEKETKKLAKIQK